MASWNFLANFVISDDYVLGHPPETFRHPVTSPKMLHVEPISRCNLINSRSQNITNCSRGAPLKPNYLGTKGLRLCLSLDLFRKVPPLSYTKTYHIFNVRLQYCSSKFRNTSVMFKHLLHSYFVLIQETSPTS